MSTISCLSPIPFSLFIHRYEMALKMIFSNRDLNPSKTFQGKILKEVVGLKPLSICVPQQYGGRGTSAKECFGLLAATSYHSLPLSLALGINIALFLEPLAKYGDEVVKGEIYYNFLERGAMGGLMITEPEYGSDALNMKTFNQNKGDNHIIKGIKHWQGLTGMADYWIIASRNKDRKGVLRRDIDFFISDESRENQKVEVLEYYDSAGLLMIPYGRNKVDIKVPSQKRLKPKSTGLKMMMDILHRSRLQFPGMAMGFIKRILDDSIEHCKTRIIGKYRLFDFDQVQFQLSKIQSSFTICSAFCVKNSALSDIDQDASSRGIEANSTKALVTDLMQEAAQAHAQLSGAKGYRMSHLAGKGIMDSSPFRIFEGANEMLYTQIAASIINELKKFRTKDLWTLLSQKSETCMGAQYFKRELSFPISNNITQRKLIDLGKIIARVVSANNVVELKNTGFNIELAENCLKIIRQEISNLTNSIKSHTSVKVSCEIGGNSNWMEFA
ncbi:acyl-CoA dehydrogenase family protein [Membranihabitans maritimus]|uniref:acyl-CoA dehydrogenase family protein n=1 Tax=Membranihabitans maritimus TaxID=2904244 RepID=UPI001F27D1C2|nr:acyl-CoA dehydrogenase family protein [Membranihabitans maritimus]